MSPRIFFVLAAFLCATSAPRAQTPAAPSHIVPVVFKLDDVRTNDSGYLSERWRRLLPLVRERKIKLSLGVIANSLEGDKPAYFEWLGQMQATGLVEFWFHGYDHGVHAAGDSDAPEFAARTYEEQKERFEKSQKLAKEKLGFAFRTYGPPGGGKLQPSADDEATTRRVMEEDPDMRVWLYPKPMDEAGRILNGGGKIAVLDRVWAVNIEQPLFVPNPEKFIAGYNKYAPVRRYFILQGHANKWDDARWAAFLKIVDYVTENKIPTFTASELAATLQSKRTP